ncbi:MAG: methyltransferase [Pseudomonadota bacterium]
MRWPSWAFPIISPRATRTIEDLAQATDTLPEPLYRLMRHLVGLGVFAHADGIYDLTPLGMLLTSDAPGSRRASTRLVGLFGPAWGEILHSLRTGEPGFSKAHGAEVFDHLARAPELEAIFAQVMEEIHGPESEAVAAAYDYGRFAKLMDVGGGNGSLLAEILSAYPDLAGVVFDLPGVAENAGRRIADLGLSDRCAAVGGDLFCALPDGANEIVLRPVRWCERDRSAPCPARLGRRQCIAILSRCAASPKHGRVLVVETLNVEDNAPSQAKTHDVAMLVLVGGKERSAAEYAALLDAAGLEMLRVWETASTVGIVEAGKRLGPEPVSP